MGSIGAVLERGVELGVGFSDVFWSIYGTYFVGCRGV